MIRKGFSNKVLFEQRDEYSEEERLGHLGGEHQTERLGRPKTQGGQPVGDA